MYNEGRNTVSQNEYVYTEGVIEGEPTKTYSYTYTNSWKDQLTDFDGQSIVYDACGNCTIAYSSNDTLANDNPIRYRGYYLYIENNIYYLNSRYYSPEPRRFISPDDTTYLDPKNVNGLNLYCYCNNDPVNYADPSGHFAFWILTAIIGAAVGVGITAAVDYIPDQEFNLHWGLFLPKGANKQTVCDISQTVLLILLIF